MPKLINITEPEIRQNCLKMHKEVWTGVQDYTLKQMAKNNNLTKDYSLTYTDVIRHEKINLQSTKKINISEYVDKILEEHGLKPDNQDSYFGIANLSVSGCREAELCIGGSYFGSIYTDMTNTFWLLSNKRCMPYKFMYYTVTMDFFQKISTDTDIIVEFDIVKINFNHSKAYEWISLIDRTYNIDLKAGQNDHILRGNEPLVSINVKPSKPINSLSLNLNKGIPLNEDCSDLNMKQDRDWDNTYIFPFTYNQEKDYWTLQLQEFVDDDKNISNADCTLNLSKYSNNDKYPHISLMVDKLDDSEITLFLHTMGTNPIRCCSGMAGFAFSK